MKCTLYDIRDETGRSVGGAFLCGTRQRAKRCSNCEADATRLCDAPLRGRKTGKTCDAPLCERCAMRLKGVDGDLCPAHARTLTADEVNAVRGARAAAATDMPTNVITVKSDEQRAADTWLDELVNDPNAVDRDALAQMFPQWPDVATTYTAIESARFDAAGGTVGSIQGAYTEEPGERLLGERPRDVPPADATQGHRGDIPFPTADDAARYVCKAFGIDPRELDDIPMEEDLPDVGAMAAALASDPEVAAAALRDRGARSTVGAKVRHVQRATQTRTHACHWPGCPLQVPPAMWGCKSHWYSLPKALRDKVWRVYRPGQENDMRPSREYLDVADEVQAWIAKSMDEDIPF